MKTRTICLGVAVVAVLLLVVGGVGASSGFAPGAPVAGKINYQGRLTDTDGTPLSGAFSMRFQVYDAASGGTLLWDSGMISVDVDQGLFNAALDVDPSDFDGQALWIRLHVDGEWLTPRQELLAVPYALSLRPGARIDGPPPQPGGAVLRVAVDGFFATGNAVRSSAATGTAIYGESTGGFGVRGYSDTNWGVRGESGSGIAGHFQSEEGYGVRVNSDGADHWDHAGYFTADWGYGVYAVSEHNYGVVGEGVVAGVRGTGDTSGVSGSSDTGIGVSGWSNSNSGVYGSSFGEYGVEGLTWRGDNNYGLFTYDNLYSLNIHLAGAVMHVVQNGGDVPLEPGDVAVFNGIVPSPDGGAPVIQVALSSSANSTAVAGVVHSRFNIEAVVERAESEARQRPGGAMEITSDKPVAPGDYLLLVVQGPAQVKATGLSDPIQPGDLLSTASQAGTASRAIKANAPGAESAAPGTVFGKALEPLEVDQRLIYVFVALQ